MARPLKDAGLREVAALRRRARRQLTLARVLPEDAAYIIVRCDEIEARIVSMQEFNEDGKEE
jgi:hypothetical protein